MRLVVFIKNEFGTDDNYVLLEEYNGFGIYRRKDRGGHFIYNEWILSNNNDAELVIESFNYLGKEKLLNMIDNYNNTKKFGVKAVMYCGSLRMHPKGQLV